MRVQNFFPREYAEHSLSVSLATSINLRKEKNKPMDIAFFNIFLLAVNILSFYVISVEFIIYLLLHYNIHYQTNALEKGMNPLISQAMS